jgi:hypothetical protein
MRTPEPPNHPEVVSSDARADVGGGAAAPAAEGAAGQRPAGETRAPGAEKSVPGPSQEVETPRGVGGAAISESTTALAGCPELEELAAFLDGKLTAEERTRLTEHLASCESCYRIFAGTARFLEESREDGQEQPSQPLLLLPEDSWQEQSPSSASKPQAPPRLERRRQPRASRSRGWWAGAAVAALLIATAGLVVLLQGTGGAGPSTEQLASLVGHPAAAAEFPWPAGGRYRGGADGVPSLPPGGEEFRLGVRLLDLRLALQFGNQADATEVLRLLNVLLNRLDYPPTKTIETYRGMKTRVQRGEPLPALLAAAPAAEKQALAELAEDPRIVELGRWTEACRLAGTSGRADLFRDRSSLRVLDRAIEPGGKDADDLDPAVVPDVRAIRDEIAAGRASPKDLGKRCQDLLKKLDYE